MFLYAIVVFVFGAGAGCCCYYASQRLISYKQERNLNEAKKSKEKAETTFHAVDVVSARGSTTDRGIPQKLP